MSERARRIALTMIALAWIATSCAPAIGVLAERAMHSLPRPTTAPVAFPARVH
ncbi:hypothetical protein RA307_10010 [Xanthobacteraceae bacterium Astr-EGSB]|uniref:hypothetical protein n=1 Tax=Astrobacterium formosum TaxID=3069710 RepID=UPI0027B3066A|nr:hypothetical protein [Xanthobacteraceae bacterium Astr-EGSB]